MASFIKNRLRELWGASFFLLSGALLASLLTHHPTDPSWNVATPLAVHNLLGNFGAITSDLFLQLFGPLSYLACFLGALLGISLMRGVRGFRLLGRVFLTSLGFFFLSLSLALWNQGGAVGYLLLRQILHLPLPPLLMAGVTWLCGVAFSLLGIGVSLAHIRRLYGVILSLNFLKSRSTPLSPRKEKGRPLPQDKSHLLGDYGKTQPQAQEPVQKPRPIPQTLKAFSASEAPLIPPLDLLFLGKKSHNHRTTVDEGALERNADTLEAVLNDYGIRGSIVNIKPGPVVTLYELEPAPGVKSSRVIALADDIARSMSAVSARVAVVPGKNVIGIELPNKHRETVHLRELLSTEPYEESKAHLTLALGKDIGGTPIMADLSRMPHLLVAGTTGSGKSVAVNAMILSLLYQHSPEECKFIMIDPKMLELSIYDGIPHLLSPVVTDPKKAIIALRWVVREMESRYQAMSKLSVRNIEGYNKRLGEAKARGEIMSRKVQTGFDPETGAPIFENQALSLDPLPFIVVVVDEMADLMLVAGKEIESAVQRLAQMARAAGIHLIMATQRPSVDVITGTIKANFPTRISFQVTSKIDSRTILGEQGAEQLLGQGDMLYMAAGGRISRIHGPYVGDGDVEKVVQFLKAHSTPSYISEVTVDTSSEFDEGKEPKDEEDELYQQALALIYREGKASTSFIQRYLKIGYNRAARLIDKMEEEGIVSAPNHVGKREVLARSS